MDSRGLTRSQSLAAAGAAVALAVAVYLPILWFMVQHWRAVDDYSHGFLIVPLAIYFAYERRDKLKVAPIEGSWWGLAPLALSAISLTVGRLGVELMSMRAAFVLTIIGLVLLLLGRHVFRILAFPLLFGQIRLLGKEGVAVIVGNQQPLVEFWGSGPVKMFLQDISDL